MAKTDFPHGANEEKPEWLVSQWIKAKSLLEEQEAKLAESRKELEALADKVKASELSKLFQTVAVPAEPPKLPKRGGRPKGSKNKTARGKAAATKTSNGRTTRGELPERIVAAIKKHGPISVADLARKAKTQASSISTLKTSGKLKELGVKEKDNPEDKRSKLLYL